MRLILTDHPNKVDDDILRLCAQVCASSAPRWVQIVPRLGAIPNKCIFNAKHEEGEGRGICIVGWKVLTWPRVLAQFVGHALVVKGDRLTCVTPDTRGSNQLLFLRDDSIDFDSSDPMARMPTRYMPFDTDAAISRLIEVQEQIHSIKAAYPPTSVTIALSTAETWRIERFEAQIPEIIRDIALRKLQNDDRCVCDSGLSFGQCCRLAMLGRGRK